jgi:hypothetical protein
MPLSPESLIKICRGTRRLGNARPVLVVTSDTNDPKLPLAEFFIFHEFPDMPFLYSRTRCAHTDEMYLYDFGKYPEVFSARALLDSQFRKAQDHLESEVFIHDRTVANEVFYSASAMAYEEVGYVPLIEFTLFQRFAKERESMFKFSSSQAIKQIEEKLSGFPEAILRIEPKG